mmetsp:Transcript_52197/g.93115  ORF Transcript_52197/g.93115 Transcript_52197/m.93115 type:complete len:386 (-) Transcript_52197:591-1748(-)
MWRDVSCRQLCESHPLVFDLHMSNVHLGPSSCRHPQCPIQFQVVDGDVPFKNQSGPGGNFCFVVFLDAGLDLSLGRPKGGRHLNVWQDQHAGGVSLQQRLSHLHASGPQQPCVEHVHVVLTGGHAGGVLPLARLGNRAGLAVLHRRVHKSVLAERDSDLRLGAQQLGIVLHHALQTCGGLERGLCIIRVLGVNEFRDHALCGFQCRQVRLQTEHQQIDVPRVWGQPIRASTITLLILALGLLDSLQQRVQLIVLHIADHSLPISSHQRCHSPHFILWHPGKAAEVHVQRVGGTDAYKSRDPSEAEAVGILQEDEPLPTLLLELFGDSGAVKDDVDVPMAMGLGDQFVRVAFSMAEPARVIPKRGHLLLLHDHDLPLFQTEAVVCM